MLLFETRNRVISRRALVFLITLTASLLPAPLANVHAASGDLDPTFGTGGKVTTDLGELDAISAIAIQADGKIVAVGSSANSPPVTEVKFIVSRYTIGGSLDPTFGTNGVINTVFGTNFAGNSIAAAQAVVIQPDGKIVAGGWVQINFASNFALARYNSDGSLDSTFGNGGKVITSFFGNEDRLFGLAVQADGKILAAGGVFAGGTGFDFGLARYDRDGTLDATFGSGGKVSTDLDSLIGGFSHDEAVGIAVQANGKIVLVGGESGNTPTFGDFAIVRYNTDGIPDATFGSSGRVTTDFFGGEDQALAVAIQQDGKIVVGGGDSINTLFAQDFALARYDTNGSLDPTFGAGGKVATDFTTDFGTTFRTADNVSSLAIQPDGKILAAGAANGFIGSGGFALARYNTNGGLDNAFGLGGKVTTSFHGFGESASSLAIQRDGKIVLGGRNHPQPTGDKADFALARYEGSTFDTCIQDDSNRNLFQFNSTNGEYLFTNCAGLALGGTGSLVKRGGIITLRHSASDRRVLATIDLGMNRATVSVQLFSQGTTYIISDRDIRNNPCACR